MKSLPLALTAALAAMCFAGCASTPHTRIEKFPAAYAALSPAHKTAVLQRRVEEGMTRDGVFFAWGPPARVTQGSEAGKAVEQWEYVDHEPVYTTRLSVGLGYGYGRHGGYGRYGGYYPPGYGGFGYGPEVTYVPREAARVDFQDGVVTRWVRKF